MGKGSNSTQSTSSGTTSSSPDSNAYQAYLQLLQRGQGVASTPYQGYSGEEVAPVNGQQTAGVGTINQATGNIAAAGAPLTASTIQSYMDPYTQSVIDATQSDFDVQNQRANSTVTGNAAAQNALGGDRVAVAQALTQESQNRTQAPVIAGLRASAYTTALSTAQQQQQFGVAAGQAELGAGQSQVGAGTLEQSTQQAQDTQSMQDYYQQQGYPFQVAQWLASLTTGVGSQLGGTSTTNQSGTTQGPTPNPWSQVAGLGIAAAGAFSDRRVKDNIEKIGKTNDGQTIYRFNYKGSHETQIGLMHDEVEEHHPEATGRVSGIGIVDYRKATDDSVERFRGGRIAGFASGGVTNPYTEGTHSWVPQANISVGKGAPSSASANAPAAPSQQSGLSAEQMKGFASAGKGFGSLGNYLSTGDSGISASDLGSSSSPLAGLDASDYEGYGSGGNYILPGFGASRGGRVKRYANGGFADGGDPTFDDRFDAAFPGRQITAGIGASSPAVDVPDEPFRLDPVATDKWRSDVGRDNGPDIVTAAKNQGAPLAPDVASNDNTPTAGVGPVAAINRAIGTPTEDAEPSSALAYSGSASSPVASSGAEAAGEEGLLSRFGINMTPELRQGLIHAGFAMMASRRGGPGSFLGAAGEGGMAGVGAYSKSQEAQRQQALEDFKLRSEVEDRSLKQASSPLIRSADGQMVVNPAWVKMKQQEADISSQPKTPFGWQVDDDGKVKPIPGGPADPSYMKSAAEARAKVPFGWHQEEDGSIVPTPGGPADPKYIRDKSDATTKEKWTPAGWLTAADGSLHPISQDQGTGRMKDNVTGKEPLPTDKITPKGAPKGPSLSDYDAQAIARYTVATGDESRLRSLGFNPDNKALVQKYVTQEMEKNSVSDADMAKRKQEFSANGISQNAAARTRATREENLNMILKATAAAVPAALEESEKVERYTGYVPLDRLIQKGEIVTNDPNLVTFGMANLQLAEHWARAMNPMGVMRESDRDLALHYLDTAFSKGTYKTAVMQLQKQVTRERDAIHEGKPGQAESGVPVPGQETKTETKSESGKPKPAQKDIDYAKSHPEVREKFIAKFGVEP